MIRDGEERQEKVKAWGEVIEKLNVERFSKEERKVENTEKFLGLR
jgi:hypothetical protein